MTTTEPKYRIQADSNSWNICERRVAGDNATKVAPGTVTYTPIKYYGDLEQAAMGLLQICARENCANAYDCEAIIEAVEQAKAEVIEAIQELKDTP